MHSGLHSNVVLSVADCAAAARAGKSRRSEAWDPQLLRRSRHSCHRARRTIQLGKAKRVHHPNHGTKPNYRNLEHIIAVNYVVLDI